MTPVDIDSYIILIRIKDRLIAANNALAVAAQMSADILETLGEPQKANFLRRCTTEAARSVATSNIEFAELLKRSEQACSEEIEVFGQLEGTHK